MAAEAILFAACGSCSFAAHILRAGTLAGTVLRNGRTNKAHGSRCGTQCGGNGAAFNPCLHIV
jgi:hypothetical protein